MDAPMDLSEHFHVSRVRMWLRDATAERDTVNGRDTVERRA